MPPVITPPFHPATTFRLSSLRADVFGRALHYAACAFLGLLADVLGPGTWANISLLAEVLRLGRPFLCHDVVVAHAQCKDEATEYAGFGRHGNADTPELKSVAEWLEEKLAKTATEEHKDAEK